METRKVQITGKSTYIISLPKPWVNKVKIRNGNSVIMIPRSDGTLLINPKLRENENISAGDFDEGKRRYVARTLGEYRSPKEVEQVIIANARQLVAVGDRVAYPLQPGAYAEERLIDAHRLVKLPDGIDDTQAAASMLKGLTAWYLLRVRNSYR